MSLSAEAIIGVIGLLLALLPFMFIVWTIIKQRHRNNVSCSESTENGLVTGKG
jgi:hypothetical protein